jgi:hypothetical protein
MSGTAGRRIGEVSSATRARGKRLGARLTEIPGTHEPGFVPPRLERVPVDERTRRLVHGCMRERKLPLELWRLGECNIIIGREPEGINGEERWHLSISHPERHPSWDEIKTARYRLLPLDRAFAMILPPPEFYVNVPAQDHVFHLHEIEDAAKPWETM